MDLYGYQARNLFRQHSVPVLDGAVAITPRETRSAAQSLFDAGSELVIIKAQVKTGNHGRAGGVKLVRTAEEAGTRACDILGMDTKGHAVCAVLISDGVNLDTEYYFSILLNYTERQYLVMRLYKGGMDIEALTVEYPEALARIGIDPLEGITPTISHRTVETAGFEAGPLADKVTAVIERLWKVFTAEDATLMEADPLVEVADDRIIALDGKVALDDNSRFRHSTHAELVDNAATDPPGVRAREAGLNYARLEGGVGVLGNNAGLVMSTLDAVAGVDERHDGMRPANFLDLGGGSSAEVMATDLEVVTSDPRVHTILVNIFGGITSCDTVTQGIVTAVESLSGLLRPVVMRLDSNSVDIGRAILADAAIESVIVVDIMDEAADVITTITKRISGRPAGKEA